MQTWGRQRTLCSLWRRAGEKNEQSDIGCICNLAPHHPLFSLQVEAPAQHWTNCSRKWGKGDTRTGYIQSEYTVSNKNWVKKVQNEKNISYLLVVFSPKRELKTKEY